MSDPKLVEKKPQKKVLQFRPRPSETALARERDDCTRVAYDAHRRLMRDSIR